jgi:hypothetical protein
LSSFDVGPAPAQGPRRDRVVEQAEEQVLGADDLVAAVQGDLVGEVDGDLQLARDANLTHGNSILTWRVNRLPARG